MDGTTEGTKTRMPRRGSVEGEEAEGADPPQVKEEERSDEGKRVVLKERDSMQSKRKAAVAAPQKEAVVAKAASLASEGKPRDTDSESSSSSDSDASSNGGYDKEAL